MFTDKKHKIKVYTLAFIVKGNEILLGLKKRGLGQGLWNGFGGKVEPLESIVGAAAREIEEECGLNVEESDLEQIAIIDFEFEGNPEILQVHVFKCSRFTGDVVESEEMQPQWYPLNEVPHDQMWPDDKIWYPLFLKGISFKGYFLFQDHSTILSYKIMDWNNSCVLLEK